MTTSDSPPPSPTPDRSEPKREIASASAHVGARDGWRDVGYVAGVHGLRGELVLAAHHPASDALTAARVVKLVSPSGEEAARRVLGGRASKRGTITRLEGILDRAEAERWRRAAVWVQEDALDPLDEGEFYLEDIRGFDARDEGGRALGRVVGFMWTNIDIAVLRSPRGAEVLFPLNGDRVVRIDTEAGVLVLDTSGLEALLDAVE